MGTRNAATTQPKSQAPCETALTGPLRASTATAQDPVKSSSVANVARRSSSGGLGGVGAYRLSAAKTAMHIGTMAATLKRCVPVSESPASTKPATAADKASVTTSVKINSVNDNSGRPGTCNPTMDGFLRARWARPLPLSCAICTCSISASAMARASHAPMRFKIAPTWPPLSA